jgi:hypothetical protein
MLTGFQFRRNPNAANAATEADLTPGRRHKAAKAQRISTTDFHFLLFPIGTQA